MSMQRVVCWDPDRVTDVINIEADSMPAAVFRAVDTETTIQCRSGERGVAVGMTTDNLLARFMDPKINHVQVAILGSSGAGKSHLVRRLQSRIEGTDGVEVLVVQRLETNLRAIIEKLVQRLPEADRGPFIDELRQAGHALTTPEVQRNALLDGLAQAIQEDSPRHESGMDAEAEVWLLEHLPDLLRDPYLRREKFLRADQIISELVDRLLSNREGKRLEERLEFQAANLPLSGIQLTQCAAPVREVVEYCLYDSDATVPNVLAILNRNLNRAITRTLNFSGERLIELMGMLRTRLTAAGKSLVILFEEFARLQGYDGAMLEALLEQGTPQKGGPCCVRWAIACTSGRFKQLPDTVQTRMDIIVDMDDGAPTLDLAAFSGRYLNAVRLGRAALDAAWREKADVPNRCIDCAWIEPCHAAFGRSDEGHGLYPFTAGALATMRARVDADLDRFNPRTFQRNVLRAVLGPAEAAAIRDGEFPGRALLAMFDTPPISAGDRVRLMDKAGDRFERYLALYQFWSGGRLANPNEGVVRAFGLEPLEGLEEPPGDTQSRDEPVLERRLNAQLSRRKSQIGAWAAGEPLDQTLSQWLRERLYALIETAIDWDTERLARATFANATPTTAVAGKAAFQRRSISFHRQATGGAQSLTAVRFELPLRRDEGTFANTARAFEALVEYDETKNWSQAGGLDALAAVRELIEECVGVVLGQLREMRSSSEWDPVAGAVELLLVGGALGGAFSAPMDDVKLVDAVFAPMHEESAAADGALRKSYEALKKDRENLITVLRAHLGGTKGSRVGRFIDPRTILKAGQRMRRNRWVLAGKPNDMPGPYGEIVKTYRTASRDLPAALAEERDRRVKWLEEVEAAFGSEENRQRILDAVTKLVDTASSAGLPLGSKGLLEAKSAFQSVQFADACRAARTLRLADPPETEIAAFARGRENALVASRALIRAWSKYLEDAKAEIAVQREEHGVAALETEQAALETSLAALDAGLATLEGQDVAA